MPGQSSTTTSLISRTSSTKSSSQQSSLVPMTTCRLATSSSGLLPSSISRLAKRHILPMSRRTSRSATLSLPGAMWLHSESSTGSMLHSTPTMPLPRRWQQDLQAACSAIAKRKSRMSMVLASRALMAIRQATSDGAVLLKDAAAWA